MILVPVAFIVAILLIAARRLLLKQLGYEKPQTISANNNNKQQSKQSNSKQKKNETLSVVTTSNLQSKLASASPKSPGILKQVHFADAPLGANSGGAKQNGVGNHSNGNTQTTTTTTTTSVKQTTSKNDKNNKKSGGGKSMVAADAITKSELVLDSTLPPLDELDVAGSILHLTDITNNNNSSKTLNANNVTSKKQQQRQRSAAAAAAAAARQRHNSESGKVNYSSEQLFKMIAASCLSKEEVEMAVETLLNKLESGEAQWCQPKNDPLLKLKSQLRDSEAALATETQNHEQTRARLMELKLQLQSERSSRLVAVEESGQVRKEFNIIQLALEKVRTDLSKQRLMQHKSDEESAKRIARLEQDNGRLQNMLANSGNGSGKSPAKLEDDNKRLRHELEDKLERLRRYELSHDNLTKNVQDLESSLRGAEIQLEQLRVGRRNDDYEACAKIAELESNRVALEKALKDQMSRLNEALEANVLLEKTVEELQVVSVQQDDLIKRLRDDRHITEGAMKKTLVEMEQELRELHEQLRGRGAANMIATTPSPIMNDERYRKERDYYERELNDAGQREQKLTVQMRQLRDGLSELFPDLRTKVAHQADDWVHQYLLALRQLNATVSELRMHSSNMKKEETAGSEDGRSSTCSTPSKRSLVDKSTQLHTTNGHSSPRFGSPTSNGGRSSRASSNHDYDKKLMENKLVEGDYATTHLDNQQDPSLRHTSDERRQQQAIQDKLTRRLSELEAQIKFGLTFPNYSMDPIQSDRNGIFAPTQIQMEPSS